MKHLITGGAGFIGSNLIKRLISFDEEIICLDNLQTGNISNIKPWLNHKNFTFIEHDLQNPIELSFDRAWHLACPASPYHYQKDPIDTPKTLFLVTYNCLELSRKNNARFFFASSSEIYGNPSVHPQIEAYKGSLSGNSERSCYELGKRYGESLCYDFSRVYNIDIRVARIFNTYGPNLLPNDGRAISNFICQSLENRPITIYGDGEQTRSFCYIDDLIEGMLTLMESNYSYPMNLGSEEELKISELGKIITQKINPKIKIINLPIN